MKENLRTILRCTCFAFVLVAALALLPANAQAQHTTGFDVAKDCPIDPVDQGATATCTFSLTNNDVDHGVESLTVTNQFPFPGGTTTPGVCLQGGVAVTVLGAAGSATDTCTGSFDEVAPITCEDTDTVILQDEIRATGLDCGPQCGVDDPPSDPFEGLPVSGSTTNVIRVNPLVCPTAPECQIAQCTPGVGCGTINADDSTPCGTDTDGNECTSPGCAAGVCAQDHIPAADSTPCGTDLDQTDCGLPGCVAGVCTQGHNDVADSTPCGTDSDTTDCTTPGCVAGVCDQTHIDVADSTPCGTDENTDDCTTPGCVAGVCDQTHIDVADSTPCLPDTDGLECTLPGCQAGLCVQTHVDECGAEGRITGGGSVFVDGQRVTHGFELHCDIEVAPNNLEINWNGNHFHLEELTSATCLDTAIDQTPPSHAPFDTYIGTGVGRCNGEPGAQITFTFVDAGEPGTADTAIIEITGCPDIGGISVPETNLKKGNHQTHRD